MHYRILKLLVLMAIALTHLGCNIYLPIKWDAWRYKSVDTPDFYPSNIPDGNGEFGHLFVNGAFVNVFFRAHNETTQGGDPPYGMHLNAVGSSTRHRKMIVHSVRISSDDAGSYAPVPVATNKLGKKVRELQYPVESLFRPLYRTEDRSYASLVIDETLDFNAKGGEIVVVEIDIEILSISGAQKGTVTYSFRPVLETGEVGYFE